MSKLKTLYIHIGTGKTGTTAIQKHFFDNREYYKNNYELQYCSSGLVNEAHHGLCANSYIGSDNFETLFSNIALLKEEIESSSCRKFLISSEDLPGLKSEDIESLIQSVSCVANIIVLAYFRRQDHFSESWYAQIVKEGNYKIEFETLLRQLKEKNILNYEYLVKKWLNNENVKSFIARPYDVNKFKNKNIFDDILDLLGVDGCIAPVKATKDPNPSLSRFQIDLVRGLSQFSEDNIVDLLKPFNIEGFKSKEILTMEEKKLLLADYKESNDWLSSFYGYEFFNAIVDPFVGEGKDERAFYREFYLILIKTYGDDYVKKHFEDSFIKYALLKSNQSNSDLIAYDWLLETKLIRNNGPVIKERIKKLEGVLSL